MERDATAGADGAADTGPLSLEDAAAQLASEGGANTDFHDTESGLPPDEGDGAEPQEANGADEEAETGEEPPEANPPPQFWDAEGREAFAKLSPDAQREVRRFEEQRNRAVAKAMQRSTEAARVAQAQFQQLRSLSDSLGEQVDEGAQRMAAWDKWQETEGVQLAQTDPAAYTREMARYNSELREYRSTLNRRKSLDDALYQQHLHRTVQEMQEVVPELTHPQEGPRRRQEMLQYLVNHGIPQDRIRWIDAREASIAWKAMQYDRAQARLKTPPAKPKQKLAGPSAPPAGQARASSSTEARYRALNSKSNLSHAEAAELMRLEKQIRR